METVATKSLKFDAQGLIPAIVQDAETNQVLMLAYMNAESLQLTLSTRETYFWSRSRKELWHKGATSGNIQHVVEVSIDCDADTLLIRVHPAGPACHTGNQTCFYQNMEEIKMSMQWLFDVIQERRDKPTDRSYTSSLFAEGLPKIAQKVGEEASEVIVAALAQDDQRLIEEVADLTYHTLVLLAARNISLAHIQAELERRHKK